ncbi:SDR family NAD(P)-dependent oxidoreductase [Terricaulis sp.]|uniref:SDR family NAD(P)-dependent oxidoreductase n=1 Tax=Terricaulis sp. TaxID=2768686 RepID=UPI003782E10B
MSDTVALPAAPSIRLDGKIALITGVGAGIGRAIAHAYAQLGATIVGVEIDTARITTLAAELGERHRIVQGDVRDERSIADTLAAVETLGGRLDIVVNNVGDNLRLRGAFETFSPENWDALYDINLRHVFGYTRAALPLLRRSGQGGSIINISTIEAYRGAPPAAVYAAFKAGITGFTRSIALELAPEQIRANIIAPETTETEQVPVSRMIAEEHRHHMDRWIPMARFGAPTDIAGAAVFLASDLSSWMTGTTLHVDGGALAAGGFYRAPDGAWTNFPVITGIGVGWRPPPPATLKPKP